LVSGTGEYEADLRRIFMLLLTIIIHDAHHFPPYTLHKGVIHCHDDKLVYRDAIGGFACGYPAQSTLFFGEPCSHPAPSNATS
jgi:hypothetical protein